MAESENHITVPLRKLQKTLSEFMAFFGQALDYNTMVYEYWNAKDILGHITFWHESFARNIADVGNHVKPNPLKGKLSEVNKQSVETNTNETITNLLKRLQQAQHTIEEYIHQEHINLIPYKKGSRDYASKEHLEVVTSHIQKHLKDLYKTFDF